MPEIKYNKKVHFDYEVLETFDAGIVLNGAEVKAAKAGLVQLEGSFISFQGERPLIKGLKIAKYPKAYKGGVGLVPERPKYLLLNKKEILEIHNKLATKGLTMVPLSVYTTPSLVKIKIALVRGKKNFDKRQSIKEKDYKRRLNSRVR